VAGATEDRLIGSESLCSDDHGYETRRVGGGEDHEAHATVCALFCVGRVDVCGIGYAVFDLRGSEGHGFVCPLWVTGAEERVEGLAVPFLPRIQGFGVDDVYE
jgi:hypothetical protein